MAELKTKKNSASVAEFIESIKDERKKKDCKVILKMMTEITGSEGVMWGSSIVGFGNYHYKYASGREGDWMLTGFSPRKQNITLYLMAGFKNLENEMKKLGKHKTAVSCLYINTLDDVDISVLKKIIQKSVFALKAID